MQVSDNLVFGWEFEQGLEQQFVLAGSVGPSAEPSVVLDMLISDDWVSREDSSPGHLLSVVALVPVFFHVSAPRPRY